MKWIKPSKIEGIIPAPPSKSMTIRGTAMALMSRGTSRLNDYSICDDALAGFRIAEALGARLNTQKRSLNIEGGDALRTNTLDCGESALCMRMFTPIASLQNSGLTLSGSGSLFRRPIRHMEEPLVALGVRCGTENGFPPVRIHGPLKAGKVIIDGTLGSQFLSGLLIALPVGQGNSEVIVANLKSKPYVRMTLSLLKRFGIHVDCNKDLSEFHIPGSQVFQSQSINVEGDWSAAAFLLAAGAIAGRVEVQNLQFGSNQADIAILEALDAAGVASKMTDGCFMAEKSDLKAFRFDATECPDLFPPLAVLACYSQGQSEIYGTERLRFKESNRAAVLLRELTGIGADIHCDGNSLKIRGTRITGGVIDSHGDHRVAMAGAIAGLNSLRGVVVKGWECVSKSYPGFFSDLQSIGGKVS